MFGCGIIVIFALNGMMMEKQEHTHPPGDLIIRDYCPDDHQSVVAVWDAAGLGGAERGDTSDAIETSIGLGGRMFVAVAGGGRVVGTSWVTYDGRRMHLHHVGVLPSYRRRGIGRLLSVASIRYARERNVQMKLEVHRTNTAALALYRSLGFTYLGDYDVYIIRKY